MSMVFPGVAEVMASPFLPVSILMRLDFPLGCTLADMVLVAALCVLADKLPGKRRR